MVADPKPLAKRTSCFGPVAGAVFLASMHESTALLTLSSTWLRIAVEQYEVSLILVRPYPNRYLLLQQRWYILSVHHGPIIRFQEEKNDNKRSSLLARGLLWVYNMCLRVLVDNALPLSSGAEAPNAWRRV